ncbi:MAG: inositol monophosphatase [archaeon]|nr:inositol monophosphatase [archaeon]
MQELLEKVIALAEEAGRMMTSENDVTIDTKGTKDNYVTSTDIKIEKFLREKLTSLIPGSLFMGEEGDIPEITDDCQYWIVDPIDGTTNYARGIPASVVSIALAEKDTVVLGVVHNPYTRETFHATIGNGAFLNGKPIHVSSRKKQNALVSLAWSTYDKKKAPLCFSVSQRLYYVCEDLRRIGTAAYEMCLLAKGSSDMLFEIRLSPWDYAAASRIVKEAGGFTSSSVGDLDLKEPCTVIVTNTETNMDFLKTIVVDEIRRYPNLGLKY